MHEHRGVLSHAVGSIGFRGAQLIGSGRVGRIRTYEGTGPADLQSAVFDRLELPLQSTMSWLIQSKAAEIERLERETG